MDFFFFTFYKYSLFRPILNQLQKLYSTQTVLSQLLLPSYAFERTLLNQTNYFTPQVNL